MLAFISDVPRDKRVAGVHCVPLLENGSMVMVWDHEEQRLTTIGGRVENGESLTEALDREAMEEAGITLAEERVPFASWYWEETDSYTVWFLTKVDSFRTMPAGFEKTGSVIMNFPTAIQMIKKLDGEGERGQIVARAGQLTGQLAN